MGDVIGYGSLGDAVGSQKGPGSLHLKVELMPISGGRPNIYALVPNPVKTLYGQCQGSVISCQALVAVGIAPALHGPLHNHSLEIQCSDGVNKQIIYNFH